MKRAAGSRYHPAMKKLAQYYLHGFGTEKNYEQASVWFGRYLGRERNSREALENARTILKRAEKRIDFIAGFSLLKIAVEVECQAGRCDSEIAQTAAEEMLICTKKKFYELMDRRNYNDAQRLLDYCRDVYRDSPGAFSKHTHEILRKKYEIMRNKLSNLQ